MMRAPDNVLSRSSVYTVNIAIVFDSCFDMPNVSLSVVFFILHLLSFHIQHACTAYSLHQPECRKKECLAVRRFRGHQLCKRHLPWFRCHNGKVTLSPSLSTTSFHLTYSRSVFFTIVFCIFECSFPFSFSRCVFQPKASVFIPPSAPRAILR